MSAMPGTRFPVSVVMERRLARHRQWTYPRWSALGVVAGELGREPGASIECRRVHRDGPAAEQFIWSGLCVELYRDAAESYWHNLLGRQPSLFIVCRTDPEGELRPCVVSADHDEASAYMEADDSVFSVALPAELYRWLEGFVLDNYRPTAPRKRRRTSWTAEDRHAKS